MHKTLKYIIIGLVAGIACGGFFVFYARATSFNEQINYQGKLTTSTGVAVADGYYCMKFVVYDAPSSGSALWSEEWKTDNAHKVQAVSGLFSIMLGSQTSISSVDFNNSERYLEVQFDAACDDVYEEVFSPRKQMGAVPAAFEAKKLGGYTWASPGSIGFTTPSTGSFTFLSASGTITGDSFATPHYTLPHVDGTAGQQLTTNGSGTATWEAAGAGGDQTPWASDIETAGYNLLDNAATSTLSFDPSNRILYADDGSTAAFEYNRDVGYNGGSNFGVRFSGPIGDASDFGSIDTNNRGLGDALGNPIMYWGDGASTGIRVFGGINDWSASILSIDPSNRQLLYTNGTFDTLDWAQQTLTDGGDAQALDWASRNLKDGSGTAIALDWANRILYDPTGTNPVLDWSGAIATHLYAPDGFVTNLVYDLTNFWSIDPNNRILYADDGTTPMLDWSTSANGVDIMGAYTLPTVDGTPGQQLTTNGSGTATWEAAGGVGGAQTPWASDIESAGYNILDDEVTPVLSIDPSNRLLYAADGTTALIDYTGIGNNYGFLSFSSTGIVLSRIEDVGVNNLTIDADARILYATGGATPVFTWTSATAPQFNGLTTAGFMKTNASGVVSIDASTYLTSSSLSGYALLDGSNQPFTGDVAITKVTPLLTQTDSGTSNYQKLSKSATNNKGQLLNKVSRTGSLGNAFSFSGSTYITVANESQFDFERTDAFSISFWIYTPGFTGSGTGLVSKWGGSGQGWELNANDNGTIRWLLYDTSLKAITSTTAIATSTWTHVVATYSNNVCRFYFNNTKNSPADTSLSGSLLNNTAVVVAARAGVSRILTGTMDEVEIYNKALSDAEVSALYNAGAGVYSTAGANHKLLLHGENNATDDSGNSNNGTWTGTPAYTNGIVNLPSADYDINTISHIDGVGAGEGGIITIGDSTYTPRIVLDGLTTRFNVSGTEKGQISASGISWIDNFKTLYGSGSDGEVYYNGTNLLIDPRAVGTGYLGVLGNLRIGDATAGEDFTLTFDGETNDGIITWMEDEDSFYFADNISLASAANANTFSTSTHGASSTTMYIGNSTINVTAPSDIKTKENIVDTQYGISDLMGFSVKDFNFKKEYVDDGSKQLLYTGMIAQDVQDIFPQATIHRSDGLLAIDYTKIIPLLIKSIQDLKNGVIALKEFVVDKFTAKTARMEKMEMVDSVTGEAYCTWIANGDWQKVKGDCATVGPAIQAIVVPIETPSVPEAPTQESVTPPPASSEPAETQEPAETLPEPQILDIVSVSSIPDINVEYGTSLSSVNLPATVTATFSDNTTQDLSVTWDNGTPSYDSNVAGIYIFSSTITLPENTTNTNNVKAMANVMMASQPAEVVEPEINPLDGAGELIQESTSGLLKGIGNFFKWLIVDPIKTGLLNLVNGLFGK